MVECNLAKVEVAGPNPVSRSIEKKPCESRAFLRFRTLNVAPEVRDTRGVRTVLATIVAVDERCVLKVLVELRMTRHSGSMLRRGLGFVLLMTVSMTTSISCAHKVTIDSNVKEAQVRVDGERLGAVEDGPVFTERGGIGANYDVEVVADGYITRRQIVKPSEIDPWVGIPAVALAAGSCCLAGCGAPIFGLLAATSDERDTRVVGYSVAGGLVGVAVGTIAVAAWGVERLPDVVTFDLTAVGDEPLTPLTPLAPLPPRPIAPPTSPKVGEQEVGEQTVGGASSAPATAPAMGF